MSNGGRLENNRIPFDDGGHEYGPTPQAHEYKTVTGLLVVPRAVGDPKLVRIHAEYGLRTVAWSAVRSQRPPVIPSAGDLPGDTYLGGTFTADKPRADPIQGGFDFSASGEYYYLQNVKRDSDDPRQLKNRAPGVDPIPTGAYPHFLSLQASQAREALASINIPGLNKNNLMAKYGRDIADGGLVDTTSLYSWPFPWFPQEASSTLFL